jgi:hypothetical protein
VQVRIAPPPTVAAPNVPIEVPTVKVMESYYEVMRKVIDEKGTEIRVPVARFPIANSNMLIQN